MVALMTIAVGNDDFWILNMSGAKRSMKGFMEKLTSAKPIKQTSVPSFI